MCTATPQSAICELQPLEPRRLLSLTPVGTETVVPTATPTRHFASAEAGDGSFIVVAETTDPANHPELVAHRYSPAGAYLGMAILDAAGGGHVSAAMDADGDAVVAYTRGRDAVAVHVSRTGTVGAALHVGAAPDDGRIIDTAVSMDRGGGFFAGWIEELAGISGNRIRIRAFDASGAPRAPQFSNGHTSVLTSYQNLEVAAAHHGAGGVYAHEGMYGWPPSTYSSRVSASAVISRMPFLFGGEPSVAMHADGSFVIAYTRWSGSVIGADQAHAAGWVQRFDPSGAPLGGTLVLGASLPDDGESRQIESVAVDTTPDGGFVATYRQTLDDVTTTYVERFDDAGVPLGPPLAIESDSDPSRDHQIGAADDGSVVVTYLEPTAGSATHDPAAVHFRRLTSDARAGNPRPESGDLFVNGTDAGERISVNIDGNEVVVSVGGAVTRHPRSAVNYLSINGFGGDDDIDNNTNIPSTIHGGDGNDTIWGGTNDDRIRGLGGDDYLRGGNGDDDILGENGSDNLHGGDGNDVLLGHAGEDTLNGARGADVMHGHLGADTLDYSNRSTAVTVTLDEFQDDGEPGEIDFASEDLDIILGGGGGDRLTASPISARSSVYGGDGEDTLLGQGARDSLYGEAGNDHLHGGGDEDYLEGGAGHDVLTGNQDDDALFGLAGNDRFLTDDGRVDVVRGGAGTDAADRDAFDDVLGVESVS